MKEQVTDQMARDMLELIVDNKEDKALNYCVNYARIGKDMVGDALKTQCIYVLNNMKYWRGPDSKKVRETLKAFVVDLHS